MQFYHQPHVQKLFMWTLVFITFHQFMFIGRNERRIRYSEFICIFYHPVSFYSEQISQTLNSKIQLKIFSNYTFLLIIRRNNQLSYKISIFVYWTPTFWYLIIYCYKQRSRSRYKWNLILFIGIRMFTLFICTWFTILFLPRLLLY